MWFFYSQISALSETASNLLAKKYMNRYDSAVVTWFWVASSTLFLALLVLASGLPVIQPVFWTVLAIRIVVDTFALLLFTRALQLEDVSLVTPLFNFSAIFSLLFSFLINKEIPSVWGVLGVVLIVLGAYLLNYDATNKNLFHPLIMIFKKKASLFMILSTLLYGFIFSISKVGIAASNLIFYTFAAALGLSITIFCIAYMRNKKDLTTILQPKNALRVLPLGIVDSVKILALMATIQTSYVSFADASNNTSILYNQFFARVFFKENIGGRFFPVLLMFAGLLCIVFLN